jgi:hypothetical protein
MPSPVLTPNWLASMQATLRADPPPARRCRGVPDRAPRHRGTDSVRRGVAAARAWWHAAFGVFVSPPIALSVAAQRRSRRGRLAGALRLRPSAYAQGERLRVGEEARCFASALLLLCFCLCPGFIPSAGQDGPLLYPGPLCGGESGSTGRAAGESMEGLAFSCGQATAWMPELRQRRSGCPSPLEKPGPDSRTCRPWMGGKRQAGWPFSLVTFSLLRASCPTPFGPASLFARASCACVATQRESNSVAVGDRKLLLVLLL